MSPTCHLKRSRLLDCCIHGSWTRFGTANCCRVHAKGMCVRASLVFVVCDKGLHLTVMGDGKTPVFQIDGFGMR
eukprot:scaffold47149_cov21-Tisochrysis_lutea.AAC.3